jgi:5-methylcytosine-specific restriction endonuclease McrA
VNCALFTTGNPCRNGHSGPRYVSNGFCVECRRITTARYRAANLQKGRDYGTARRKTHREKLLAQHKAWRQRNAKKLRASTRAYQKAHPESVAANNHRRLARKANADGRGVTVAEWRSCLADSLGLCAYCGQKNRLEMDHIDPLSKGGAHDIENIVAACLHCNRTKIDKALIVWLATLARLRAVA